MLEIRQELEPFRAHGDVEDAYDREAVLHAHLGELSELGDGPSHDISSVGTLAGGAGQLELVRRRRRS